MTRYPFHFFYAVIVKWKHPHSRGEDKAEPNKEFNIKETPPLAWGRLTITIIIDFITQKHHHHHDFIEISPRTQARIVERCAPLYEKGLSIRDIEATTGIPKSTVRESLRRSGMTLRNPLNGNAKNIDSKKNKRGGHTPFGYAYLDGQLVIDPKEQLIIRKILKLHHSGLSGIAIANELNMQKIPSRTGKTWCPCVVRNLIRIGTIKQ